MCVHIRKVYDGDSHIRLILNFQHSVAATRKEAKMGPKGQGLFGSFFSFYDFGTKLIHVALFEGVSIQFCIKLDTDRSKRVLMNIKR